MAALAFDSTIRDRVSYIVVRRAYSSVATEQQAVIDAAGVDGLARLSRFGPYFEFTAADSPPTAWGDWLVYEAALKAAIALRPELVADLRRERDDARQAALAATSQILQATAPEIATAASTITLTQIRQRVLLRMVRRGVFPDTNLIDDAVQWCVSDVWNEKDWGFRRKRITVSIASDGTVTTDSDFHAVATQNLYYTDADDVLRLVTADEFLQLEQHYGTDTGRPVGYRILDVGDTPAWSLVPMPDQAYTAKAEILLDTPAPSSAATSTPLADFPQEFIVFMLDRIAAKVMTDMGASGADQAMAMSDADMDKRLARYASRSDGDRVGGMRDVYGDAYGITGDNQLGGWHNRSGWER